jgi:uncharacterized protein RhaS with RHS repeats
LVKRQPRLEALSATPDGGSTPRPVSTITAPGYYSPSLGRFLQTDPIGYSGGLNLYTYVSDDPLNGVDPTGQIGQIASSLWDMFSDAAAWVYDNRGAIERGLGAGLIAAALLACALTPCVAVELGALVGGGTVIVGAGLTATGVTAVTAAGAGTIILMTGSGSSSGSSGSGDSGSSGSTVNPDPPSDPTQPPGEGWEWRGKPGEPVGGDKGAWVNPETGEQWHPDLNHPDPIGPHWDYKDPSGQWWRVFPGGGSTPK